MKNTQNRKALRVLGVRILLLISALAISVYAPAYMEYWRISLVWPLIALLAITCVSPFGGRVIGDVTQKQSLVICCRNVIFTYLIISCFLFTGFILLTSNIVIIPPASLLQAIQENLIDQGYSVAFYPWLLYAFAAAMIGGCSYLNQQSPFSNIVISLFPAHTISPSYAATIDYMAVLGFYMGTLTVIGISVFSLAQLLCSFFGYYLDLHIDLTIIGLGFSLVYLQISSLWKTVKTRLAKRQINPGATLVWFLVILSLFVVMMYAILHIFLVSFASYFAPLEQKFPQLTFELQLEQLQLDNLVWGFSLITMAICGAWWARLVQGYTVRQAIIILLAPLALGFGIGALLYLNHGLNIATIENIFTWLWTTPQAYLFSLLPATILIIGMWRQNNFVNAILRLLPADEANGTLAYLHQAIIKGNMLIAYSAAFTLLSGIYFMQTVIQVFAIFFSFALVLVILGYIKYITRWKTL